MPPMVRRGCDTHEEGWKGTLSGHIALLLVPAGRACAGVLLRRFHDAWVMGPWRDVAVDEQAQLEHWTAKSKDLRSHHDRTNPPADDRRPRHHPPAGTGRRRGAGRRAR